VLRPHRKCCRSHPNLSRVIGVHAFRLNQIQNSRLGVGQAISDTWSRAVHLEFVEKYDAHNLLEPVVKRDRACSAVPQKIYGVPVDRPGSYRSHHSPQILASRQPVDGNGRRSRAQNEWVLSFRRAWDRYFPKSVSKVQVKSQAAAG
jgi:hypothetical protein